MAFALAASTQVAARPVVAISSRRTAAAASSSRAPLKQLRPAFGSSSPAPRPSLLVKGYYDEATEEQQGYLRQWPEPQFIEEVASRFPDDGVADPEEARVLFSELGYTYLDVRPKLELEEVGKVRGSVNIPLVNAKRVYKAEEGKKVIEREENPDFVAQIRKRFPDLDTPLLIACSNGTTYSIDALEALDGEGYTTLVGLKGGYYNWFRVWDNKLARRRHDGYTEAYTHDGDSCGIHSTGAGFERMDTGYVFTPPPGF